MKLNATEKVVVNEVMKKWRAYVKPSYGLLSNNPQEQFGEYYTYENYALEWLDTVCATNDYNEILTETEMQNITNEIKNRVAKAEKKDKDTFNKIVRSLA